MRRPSGSAHGDPAATDAGPAGHESARRSAWRADRARATAARLAVFAFLVYALSGGGRIVGSDEVAMLDLARAMLRGGIAVPEGATLEGPDGRHYTKNAAGQAVAALPLTAFAEVAAAVPNLPPARRQLAVRFVVSFFNAFVVAVLLAFFYLSVRSLRAPPGAALNGALLLGFTTPLWPYAKSFMAEPLQALGLLLTAAGAARAAGGEARGERIAAVGAFIAVSAKLTMAPLALACMTPLLGTARRRWAWPLGGFALALAGHVLYNLARFGTPFETGYGAQASADAFTTPLFVGLYGLLLSTGKGVLWFAPILWLVPRGWRVMAGHDADDAARPGFRERLRRIFGRRRAADAAPPARRSAAPRLVFPAIALSWVVGLWLYARFQHWAGDGSFGPRYLIPLLPLAFLTVPFALARVRWRLRVATGVLAALGLLVQIGGVGIYFGAQMREAGDYPYTLPLDDPRSMSDSHFNPAFSPIAGHWSMLARNAREHLSGDMPRLDAVGDAGTRVGVGEEDQVRLLHAIDLWWLYLAYTGYPLAGSLAAAAVLLLLAAAAYRSLRKAVRVEARAP